MRKKTKKQHSGHISHSYQFGQAPLREDPSGTRKVEVSGDPASHVEPVHSSFGWGAVFSVQQHQLLLGTHSASFQHTLQLEGRHRAQMFWNILYSSLSSEWLLCAASPEKYCKLLNSKDYTRFKSALVQICDCNFMFVFGNNTLILKYTIIC